MSRIVIRAKTAGFCMGVDLALRKLDKVVERCAGKEPICTLGPIIHNPQVLNHYARQGVTQVDAPEDVPEGSCVVIRAHGVPLEVQRVLQERGMHIVDATCPKVKKAQMLIADQTGNGRRLILFGESDHPEVAGLLSYAGSHARVVEQVDSVQGLDLGADRSYFLAAQTTQDRTEFQKVKWRLEKRLGTDFPVLDTICDATRERQEEAIRIARQVEFMIVVGGFSSGNTRRLAKVVQEQGVASVHIEKVKDLPDQALQGVKRVGLTAGASTPKEVIDAVHKWAKESLS